SATIFKLFSFSNNTAPTDIFTLSLHDALPIYHSQGHSAQGAIDLSTITQTSGHVSAPARPARVLIADDQTLFRSGLGRLLDSDRSEEHTSELQSRVDLVCRLLLEKKKK